MADLGRPQGAAQDQISFQIGAIVFLAIFWSLNWPMMKIGLTVVEPWTFRALLVVVGAIGCFTIAAAAGETIRLPRRDLVPILLVGLFQGVGWNAFSGFGVAMIEAGRAAVLAFTMPVWATLLSVLILGETVTPRRLGGLALGMAAMALLLAPAFEAMSGQAIGALLMIGAAMSWAASTIVVKKHDWSISPITLSAWQFTIGAGPLWIAAVTLGAPSTLLNVDMPTFWAMAYAALVPMTLCQAIFFALVRRLPASVASMGTLLVPPFGVLFSAAILGEPVGAAEIGALALVLAAMLLILPGFSWRASRHPRAMSPPE